MSDVLDQDEVDALLTAMTDGDIADDAAPSQIFSRQRKDFENVEIREYDFKRPERISKDQMRALHTLHESFARNFGAYLSGFLRTIVEVRVAHAEQMTYGEFIAGLPNPTSFNLIDADQLDGQICLEVSPLIIYPIIDRLLGGTNQDLFIPQRPMTLIESRLIETILERAMEAMTDSWESLSPIKFTLGEMESNPQIMQIVPPNEVVVVIGFEIKMTNRAGTMTLCIPFNVIEPVIEQLSSQNWFHAGKEGDEQKWSEVIAERLAEAKLEVSGILAETTITLAELRALEVGDVITTEKPASAPAVLAAGGHGKYFAHVGQFKGRRALRIVRAIDSADRTD